MSCVEACLSIGERTNSVFGNRTCVRPVASGASNRADFDAVSGQVSSVTTFLGSPPALAVLSSDKAVESSSESAMVGCVNLAIFYLPTSW